MEKRYAGFVIYKKTQVQLDGTMYAIRWAGHEKAKRAFECIVRSWVK